MTTFASLLLSVYACCIIGYGGTWNTGVEGERILAIAPRAGKSHWLIIKGIVTALTDRGHNVTVCTPFPDGNRENYTEIDLSEDIAPLVHLDIGVVRELFTKYSDLIDSVSRFSREICEKLYGHGAVKEIMADGGAGSNFDVVIVELTASECVSYLSAKLDVPLIYVTAPPLMTYVERSVSGHYPNPAVVSHTFADHSVPRTFAQRFANAALSVYTICLIRYKFWYAGVVDRQPFDLADRVKPSIVFSNAHFVMDAPRPLPQNVVPVGGIHLRPPERIPDDILDFIENSTHGIIFFTLGSILKTSSLPEHVQDILIEVLGQLSQRVLLKYEDAIINKKKIPDNIMIKNWFPQRDILSHPNVKLFISHGGISGMYEAVDSGVPVLGLPLFYDQSRNINNLVDKGMAILLDLESVTKDTLLQTILELINNEKYRKNAKITSELFRDRPMSPAQTVEYWTRYAIRHKGAPHLKSSAFHLTWYQYFLLDVIFVLAIVFLFIFYVAYLVLYYVIYKLFVSMLSFRNKKSKSE